jgi:hypothetical protein
LRIAAFSLLSVAFHASAGVAATKIAENRAIRPEPTVALRTYVPFSHQ